MSGPVTNRSVAFTWGSRPAERRLPFPCDPHIPEAEAAYFRAVDVQAPAEILFRWLCQLRVAPYSYDWIDNGGRRSPTRLTPGLEQLAVGQRFMTIFTLLSFTPDEQLTLAITAPRSRAFFGQIVLTYAVLPQTPDRCRLVVKLLVNYPPNLRVRFMRWFLPWGDVIMMRRQLRTLRRLAEQAFRAAARATPST